MKERLVLVQGDTTTTLVAALVAYGCDVGDEMRIHSS